MFQRPNYSFNRILHLTLYLALCKPYRKSFPGEACNLIDCSSKTNFFKLYKFSETNAFVDT